MAAFTIGEQDQKALGEQTNGECKVFASCIHWLAQGLFLWLRAGFPFWLRKAGDETALQGFRFVFRMHIFNETSKICIFRKQVPYMQGSRSWAHRQTMAVLVFCVVSLVVSTSWHLAAVLLTVRSEQATQPWKFTWNEARGSSLQVWVGFGPNWQDDKGGRESCPPWGHPD